MSAASSRGVRSQQAVTLHLPFNPPTWLPVSLADARLCCGLFSIALTHSQRDLPAPVQIKQALILNVLPSWKINMTCPGKKQNEACLWPHAYFATWVSFLICIISIWFYTCWQRGRSLASQSWISKSPRQFCLYRREGYNKIFGFVTPQSKLEIWG